jgi:hypothetical protein
MKVTVPPLLELQHLFNSEDRCITYLRQMGIFYTEMKCDGCHSDMEYNISRQKFRCPSRRCRKEKTVRTNSFFQDSKLPCRQILSLAYWWLLKLPQKSIETVTNCDSKTVQAYLGYFRQLVGQSLDDEDCQIGGHNIVVEVDESKFSRRKYNRGHAVDGAWILGGVERTDAKRLFLTQVPDRSASTLLDILAKHVHPGSTVMTDLWRGYIGMADALNVQHLTVNHTLQFKNCENGACTNTIEGTWNGVKMTITPRQRSKKTIDQCLLEYIWRRRNKTDLWGGLLNAMKETHYH